MGGGAKTDLEGAEEEEGEQGRLLEWREKAFNPKEQDLSLGKSGTGGPGAPQLGGYCDGSPAFTLGEGAGDERAQPTEGGRRGSPTCLQRSSACFLSASACSARSMAFSLSSFSICIFFLMASMAAVGGRAGRQGAVRTWWTRRTARTRGARGCWVRRTERDWVVSRLRGGV